MHILVLLAAVLVQPPEYASVKNIGRYATVEEYSRAASDSRYRLSRVAYESDGLNVFAYVYAPAQPKENLPVIVFNRGSWVWPEFAGEYLTTFWRLAEAGFVVVAPMYRQSGGAPGRDEMGGADVNDLMNVMTVIESLPGADARSVFLYGESRGGMMAYQAVARGFPAKAAAVIGAFTDLAGLIEAKPQAKRMTTAIWPDYDATTAPAIHERRSAIAWAEKLNVPLLIMHGGADNDVPPGQSLALAMKLESLGRPYELIIRAGENHILSGWRNERDARAVEWFRRHQTARPSK
jgi:dipeptidyl aminopeptidase/acylaminoacyl peptidase